MLIYILSVMKVVGVLSGCFMILVWNVKVIRMERMGSWFVRMLNVVLRVKCYCCYL